jgi:hypothetical protein
MVATVSAAFKVSLIVSTFACLTLLLHGCGSSAIDESRTFECADNCKITFTLSGTTFGKTSEGCKVQLSETKEITKAKWDEMLKVPAEQMKVAICLEGVMTAEEMVGQMDLGKPMGNLGQAMGNLGQPGNQGDLGKAMGNLGKQGLMELAQEHVTSENSDAALTEQRSSPSDSGEEHAGEERAASNGTEAASTEDRSSPTDSGEEHVASKNIDAEAISSDLQGKPAVSNRKVKVGRTWVPIDQHGLLWQPGSQLQKEESHKEVSEEPVAQRPEPK